MNEKEAGKLEVGDIVESRGGQLGTVTRTAYKYIKITWDKGSAVSHLHPDDYLRVFRAGDR